MNFMSGRTGFSEEIADSAGIIMPSSSSSLQPYICQYLNHHHQEAEAVKEDTDGHMLANSTTASQAVVMEWEHMFDKVVTPSDVGKLNRLVIPKQHAEKYFPLDSSTNEKGLLLNFEDRNGKPWRFRYSYWNSSQSYVMTKGWSRFVKEKKLDAGDIVSFQRGLGDLGKDRLFIDWRRRPDATDHLPPILSNIPTLSIPYHFSNYHMRSIHPRNPNFLQQQPPGLSRDVYSHLLHHHHPPTSCYGRPYAGYNSMVNGNSCPRGSIVHLNSGLLGAAGSGGGVFIPQHLGMVEEKRRSGVGFEQMVFESVPVVQGKAAAKRLRLFGVNMDCPISESDHEYDLMLSSSSITTTQLPHSNMPLHLPLPPIFDSSSASASIPFLQLRPNYKYYDDDKGKGSISIDSDI